MKRITTIALHSVFLVALVFSTGHTLAQQETQEKQQTEKKQVPTEVPRPLPDMTRKKLPVVNDSGERYILFMYREGSISSADIKHIVEATNLTIKTKSSPRRLMPGASNISFLEQLTLAEFGAMLFSDDTTRGGDVANPRMAKSPTLSELFRKHGPVLFFNAKQTSEGGPGPCPRPISPSCVDLVRPPLLPFCMCLLDLDIPRLGESSRMSSPDTSQRLIVITFNQTPETLSEFKGLFCTLYHGDCGGPIGKPTPLPEPVTVRTYAPLKWNGPIEDERALRQALDTRAIDTPIKLGDQPAQTITCMRRDAQGNCNWWRICGSLGPNGAYRCYDIMDLGPGIGWQVAW
ncbi:hypothetical protein ACVW0Q_002075 [Thermostichus sp. MS-CIW-21]